MKQKGGNHGWQAMKKTEKTSLLMAAFCNEFPTRNHANPEEDVYQRSSTWWFQHVSTPLKNISQKGNLPQISG